MSQLAKSGVNTALKATTQFACSVSAVILTSINPTAALMFKITYSKNWTSDAHVS